YLTWPIEPRELVATVEALLRMRRAERNAREKEELLRVTLSSIGDAVIATGRDLHVTFLNPMAESLTGWRFEQAVGRHLDQIFHIINEATRQRVDNPTQTALHVGQAVGLTNRTALIARDGTERPIEDSAAPIRDSDGTLVGLVLVFRDVTERRQAEMESREAS